MKALYLIRHAKSSWEDDSLTDHKRPLNSRGLGDVPLMAKNIKKNKIFLDHVLSSDAIRAQQTAVGICEGIHFPKDQITYDPWLYHASLVDLLEKIYNTNKKHQSLMIIGHNPGFTELASILSGQYIENVATCGFVAMHFKTKKWENINKSNVTFFQYTYPKMYKKEAVV